MSVHYKSLSRFEDTLYLDLQKNHLSYVPDVDVYAKRFQCQRCNRLFKRYYRLKRHYAVCSKMTKLKFPGGFHKPKLTVFEELEKYGINVPLKDRLFKYFITYDFEAILKKINTNPSNKLVWEEIHQPISCGVASNFPGKTKGKCFVNYNLDELLAEMVKYMHSIAEKVEEDQKTEIFTGFSKTRSKTYKFKRKLEAENSLSSTSNSINARPVSTSFQDSACEVDDYEPPCKKFSKSVNLPNSFDKAMTHLRNTNEFKTDYHQFSSNDSDSEPDEENLLGEDENQCEQNHSRVANSRQRFIKTMISKIENLRASFSSYCRWVPVLGFNSSKYDLNLVKSKLARHLNLMVPNTHSFTVKRNNSYLTISTPSLKFLDISHFIAL